MPTNVISGVRDLGVLGGPPVTALDFVNHTNTSDFFRFSLTSPSNINLALTGLSADADVRIIRDVNGNGTVDAGDEIIRSSRSGTADESINLNNQAAGNYFAQVYTYSYIAQYSGNINYTLRLSNARASNLLLSEINLGVINNRGPFTTFTQFGSVDDSNTSDIYQFSLTSASDINLSLTGLTADADVVIVRDANNNGILDAGEVVGVPNVNGTAAKSINLHNQAAGNYFALVYQWNGNTSYTLRLNDSPINNLIVPERVSLGALSSAGTTRIDFVEASDTSDIYQFSLTRASNINVSLTGLVANANVRIIRDANNNGMVDVGEVVYTASSIINSHDKAINLNNQAAGIYFVQVYQDWNNTNYTLRLNNSSINSLIVAERNLGALSTTAITCHTNLNNLNTSDIFQFTLTNADDINVSLTGLSYNADARIIRDANNNGVVNSGEVVASSVRYGAADESINLNNQAAGTYFVQVYQFGSGFNPYTLKLSNAGTSNLLSSEGNLGFIGAGIAVNQNDFVGNSDTSDIYRFSLSSARTVTARLSGLSADADLRIIRDANNNRVVDAGEVVGASARSGTSVDDISSYLGAGDYFVQVYQYSGDTYYNLAVSA